MTRASGSSIPDFIPPTSLKKGELIADKYRLIRQIGEGAMGWVWIAKNEVLEVDIAIKFMRIDTPRADPSNMYKRLLQEARAAARLGHPAIVRVFDFGQTPDNTPFIVMELLKGEPLSALLGREGKLDVTRALQMMLPIADALATAHGRGIVHRDIKPENIFIASDEYGRLQPKIVDFGIARFSEGSSTLTRSGALLGTPDYMSPEQARGEPDIDHRVDVWALCVVLYELMVGRRPFGQEGSNYLAVLRAIVHDPIRPILEFGVGDKALWVIIERGLRKRRQERWDTMRVFGESLALWLYERGIREDAFGASLKTGWLQAGIDGVRIDTTSMMPTGSPEAMKVIHELDELLGPPSAPSSRLNAERPLAPTIVDQSLLSAGELQPPPPPPVVSPASPPQRVPLFLALAATGVAVAAVAVMILALSDRGRSPTAVGAGSPVPVQVAPPAVPPAVAPAAAPEAKAPGVESAPALPPPLMPAPGAVESSAKSSPAPVLKSSKKPPARATRPARSNKTQKKPGSFDLGF